ncbi:MAG: sodium-dependent transporter [Nitrospinota bacterium]|nr:sodium-dependent transporter [Nitrospinota bacterium]
MKLTTAGDHPERGVWGSRLGFLLAAIGSAVGLGNIWRFPYMAYSNGGGAFLIPYGVAFLTVGLPLLLLEFGLGHRTGKSAPLAMAEAGKCWEWVGWWALFIGMFGVNPYYCVIIGWTVDYFVYAVGLAWGADPGTFFFKEFLGQTSGPGDLGGFRWPILIGTLLVWGTTWGVTRREVRRGIELANKIMIPTLFLLIIVLVFWSLTLEGARAGIRAYLTPDFAALKRPRVWVDAYAQIFFSMSLGFGIMVAFASYLPRESPVGRSALTVGVADGLFAVFAGFAIFATLGYMSQVVGKPVGEVVTQSIGLAFVVYPEAINKLPAMRPLFGAIFFLALALAGISSAISLTEAFVAALVDKFRMERRRAVTILCSAGVLLSLTFTTGGGLFWLDIVDHFITHYGLVTIGVLEAVFIGYILKPRFIRDHLNQHRKFRLTGRWDLAVMVLIPLILILVIGLDLLEELRGPYGNYPWTAILLLGWGWLAVLAGGAAWMTRQNG